jgi:pseudouridine kinase
VFGADGSGDIVAAVAACDLVEQEVTAEWVAGFRKDIKRAPLLILDANLSPETLVAAARMAAEDRVPVLVEPVSVAKAGRAVPALRYTTWIKPNALELLAIAAGLDASFADKASTSFALQFQSPSDALQALRPAIELVLHAGVVHIITTLGPTGVLLSSRDPETGAFSHWALPAAPVLRVLSTAGAGDALVAGTVAALTTQAASSGAITSVAAVRRALVTGAAAAAVVVQHRDNAPPQEAFAGVLDAAAGHHQRAGYVLA